MNIDARLHKQVAAHPYPLLFATISGAHLYGFPSPDSDFDLRGVHLLPLRDVVGMSEVEETVEKSGIHDGLEIDLVTHDAKKVLWLDAQEERLCAGTTVVPADRPDNAGA